MTVCFFGIYDPLHPRTCVLMEKFRTNGFGVCECRVNPRTLRGVTKYWELYRRYLRIEKL